MRLISLEINETDTFEMYEKKRCRETHEKGEFKSLNKFTKRYLLLQFILEIYILQY